MQVVGLDIGGANLKAATSDGATAIRPFALWRASERLPHELSLLLGELPPADLLAVTMTAELADCYPTKAAGVADVLSAVEQAAGSVQIAVWQTGAEFVTPHVALEIPLLVAAANWHALATWVGRMVPHTTAILIDVGSTTSDLIPLLKGTPIPEGLTDCERLVSGELVYTGVRRTPVCALASAVPLDQGTCPLAAELFATALDVHLLTGDLPQDPSDAGTADGRPATIEAARARLARMLCCDRNELTDAQLARIARFLAEAQLQQLGDAWDRVAGRLPEPLGTVLVCGSGSFLGWRLAAEKTDPQRVETIMLEDAFDPQIAAAACAHAVARLAAERIP